MSTITVSRQLGTPGTEIAREVAERLNYEFVDKQRIGEILTAGFGLGAADLEKFDEKKPPFWEFLSVQKTKYLLSIRAAIYDIAQKGRVVILGRGGQVLLRTLPGILHVRIFAPFSFRVKHLMEIAGGDEKEAARKLQQSDHDSAAYIHSFFNADWEDASLYDLVLNAETLSPPTAVQLIMACAQSREIQDGVERGKERLADLALAQKAEAKLIATLGYAPRPLEIRVERGVVFLQGTVSTPGLKKECERLIAAVEGVKQVRNELSVAQYYPYST